MSNRYNQKILDSTKNSTTDAVKTTSKRAIQKTAEATGGLIGNAIVDKITSISKSPQNASRDLHPKTDEDEIEIPKERHISLEKRQKIIDELRFV